MLEIFLVIGLCRVLGNMLRAKGRKPFWMQCMLVVFWLAGEFAAGIVAGIVHVMRNGPQAPMGWEIYLFAIAGAAVGAGFTFFVAYLLPPLNDAGMQGQELASNYASRQKPGSEDPFDRHLDPDNPYSP